MAKPKRRKQDFLLKTLTKIVVSGRRTYIQSKHKKLKHYSFKTKIGKGSIFAKNIKQAKAIASAKGLKRSSVKPEKLFVSKFIKK